MRYTANQSELDQKREELINFFMSHFSENSTELNTAFRAFCRLTPPMDPPQMARMILLNDLGRGGGETRKPGNILLNWKSLLRESGDLVLNAAGAITTPWLIPFAALSLWNKLHAASRITITKEQAVTLFVLWRNCDDKHNIAIKDAFSMTAAQFVSYEWPTVTQDYFRILLEQLEEFRCIEINDDLIWLREWSQRAY